MHSTLSDIQKTYNGATIFITGATGFIGKLLLEKILRSLNAKRVYVLVRSKKGKNIEERFNTLFESPVFDEVKSKFPNFLEKVSIISGDLLLPGLGLSDQDKQKLMKEVNFVFHSAATVRFDETFNRATTLNVKATKDILELAKLMQQLKLFIHVSTAYSHCPRKNIDEKCYEPGITADNLISVVDVLEENVVNKIEKDLLGEWPNTYTLTKAITEDLVKLAGNFIPTAIMRPSIVVGAAKEPIRGFTDSLFGMTGMSVGNGIGLIHTMHGDPNFKLDIVPVDYVVNNLLAIGWYVTSKQQILENVKTPVFNCVSGRDNPITFGGFTGRCFELSGIYPSAKIFWYPFAIYSPNWYLYFIMNFLFHTLPSYIVDFIAICSGKEPGLVKGYKRLGKMSKSVHYFILNEWNYGTDKNKALFNAMSPKDRVLFNFNISDVKWHSYIEDYYLACRNYVVKDPIETLPQGKRRLRIMKISHFSIVGFVIITVFFFLRYLLFKLFA